MKQVSECDIIYPGRIVSFDPVEQTAEVQLSIETLVNGQDFSYRPSKRALLLDVPVQFPQGGGYQITFPVKEGDDCLVFFSQRGYDHWLYSDKQEAGLIKGAPAPDHRRSFSPQDALALVGFRPIPKAIQNFATDGMVIRNEGNVSRIKLKDGNDIEVDTPTQVTVTAPTINLVGNVNITGNLTTSGTTTGTGEGTFNGIAVSTHTHNDSLGNPTTPPL